MREKKIKIVIIALCLFGLYLLSFFFVFCPIKGTKELLRDQTERTGPKGISIVSPIGKSYFKKSIFYFYYPIHAPLKAKGWIYPVRDIDIFCEGD